jgi:hypothetical protein
MARIETRKLTETEEKRRFIYPCKDNGPPLGHCTHVGRYKVLFEVLAIPTPNITLSLMHSAAAT